MPLTEHFLACAASCLHKRCRSVSTAAAALLRSWRWPGNVRELKAVIERAVLMQAGDVLLAEHLPADLLPTASIRFPPPGEKGARVPTLEEVEVRYMRRVAEPTGGNKVRAAAHLGITRQTLAKRLGETK